MSEPATRAGRREWIGLAVIALPCMLYSMDLTVLNLALPSLSAALQPSATQLLWIGDVYGFTVAGFLITMGTLGDRIGRRRLLMIGAGAFGVASVLAAFSTSAAQLIASRAVLGIAGATLAPSTLSLIRNMFHEPHERRFAIGVWIASYSAGAALGPALGGMLLAFFWWGSVFLIGVPVMVLLLIVGPVLLPEYRDPQAGRIDPTSAALSLAAVLAIIFGIKQIAADGMAWPWAAAIVTGVVIAAVFVVRQSRLADPLIDLRLFRRPAFSAALAIYALATFIVFGPYVFVGQFIQLVLGLSPLMAGLWTIPFSIAFIVGSMLSPLATRTMRPGYLMAAGLLVAAVGYTLLARVDGSTGIGTLVCIFVLYALGVAPAFTLATDIVVGNAPPERAGAASALSETGSEFGGALGIAILGSIGTAIYRSDLAARAPLGLAPDVLETARSTLGAALSVAAQLGGEQSTALIEAVRSSFVESLQAIAAIAAALTLVTAIVAAVALGRATRAP